MASVGVARDVSELREALASGEASLVDVREYPEWAGGRVAGSRLVPLGEIAERAKEIDRDKPVYVICRSGRRSATASELLARSGFSRVVDVAGGTEAWIAAGGAVER